MERPLFMEEIGARGVARLTLTRADKHNAFNDKLIVELTQMLRGLESDPRVRVVVLAAEGQSFSAGADLNWMRSMAQYGEEQNLADARQLAALMATLNGLKKPTLALVQGPAIGGGVGLVACCDIAIAASSAFFCLSEVRLGLSPSVISPYVVAAIGARAARRFFLTAERFSADEAEALGLVHEVVPDALLQTRGDEVVERLLEGGPEAQAETKDLIASVAGRQPGPELSEETARRIARLRAGAEGQEGMAAFFEKRKPGWTED
ncbi:MAG: enoyl-CoA hydratase-related protein [Limibacillus sp.]|jgi:methylglutaconyl-CoA hydratase